MSNIKLEALEFQIKRAAYDYYSKEDSNSYRSTKGYNGFIAGAEWAIEYLKANNNGNNRDR